MAACDGCKFFKPSGPDGYEGECRRHAPRATLNPRTAADGDVKRQLVYWPEITADEWCGEFEAKPIQEPSP